MSSLVLIPLLRERMAHYAYPNRSSAVVPSMLKGMTSSDTLAVCFIVVTRVLSGFQQ